MTAVCFKKIAGLEDKDSLEEIYNRRMTYKKYFKDLKMSLIKFKQRIEAGIPNKDLQKVKKQTTLFSAKKVQSAAPDKKPSLNNTQTS